jgi:hypothetical protein
VTGYNSLPSPAPDGQQPDRDQQPEDPDIAGVGSNPISHLDGNVVAGPLGELFRIDIIAALGRCNHCGAVKAFGEATVYADAPGIVVRCSSCEGVLLRLVETPTQFWIDVRGLSYLKIDREP